MDEPAPSWMALRARFGKGGFAFVIPVYNHAGNVGQVVQAAMDSGVPVVVVDDGSTDGSGDAAARIAGATVLRHEKNLGKGVAILTGLAAVAAPPLGVRFAVTVDADGQHSPDDARVLLAALWPDGDASARVGLVLGARTGMQGRAVPWSSRAGRGFSGFWVWASGGPAISDSQSGFRVYPVAETLALPTRARRFEFEVEVLVQARRAGMAIFEVPVPVTYQPPGGRVSHFRPWRDSGRNAATFTRLIATRFVPRRTRKGSSHEA